MKRKIKEQDDCDSDCDGDGDGDGDAAPHETRISKVALDSSASAFKRPKRRKNTTKRAL